MMSDWTRQGNVLVWRGNTADLDAAAEADTTDQERRDEQRRRDAAFFLEARLARSTPCPCTPATNTYASTCPRHASYRCVEPACDRAAVEGHRCAPCGRRVGVR